MTQQVNPSHLKNIRIVLVNTSHPGNIGAVARAMKNMGLSRLYLVAPAEFPSLEAIRRSAGALDVLDQARVVDTLDEALASCVWVAGTSARMRTIEWPVYRPAEAVSKGVELLDRGEIAIVFGRENNGLTNAEMERCNVLLNIPANPEYSSLNIASAVQIICYEFRQALTGDNRVQSDSAKHRQDSLADSRQLAGLYKHFEEVLHELEFFGNNKPDIMMRRLKRFFQRAGTTQREVSIFRGIFSAILHRNRGTGKREETE